MADPRHAELTRLRCALTTDIDASEKKRRELESQHKSLAESQSKAKALLILTKFIQSCRAEIDGIGPIRFLPAMILPMAATAIVFFGGIALFGSAMTGLAIIALLLSAVLSATVFVAPPDATVATWQAWANKQIQSLADCERMITAQHGQTLALTDQLRPIEKELNAINSSVEYGCKKLYDERWKEMRGEQFEEYLARVFANLGYDVERTGQSGDHGVDLVVVQAGRRIAIQAKGYVSSVSNGAVQEAFTGRTIWKCHACAVITNSRFTSNAIEAAEATGCTLIGEDNFQDFVFGRVRLS